MLTQPYTHGLWAKTAPPAPALTALAEHLRCDVAIIGAGYTGLSAALHLAQAGADVIVLEAEEIGFGGSGRNVGLVNAGMWIMPDDMVEVLGKTYQERLLHELGEAPNLVFELIDRHKISCEAVRNGTLHCAVGCQTPQQAAEARTKVVCFQAGYGETSPHHAECMRTMLPVAQQMEMRQRMDDIGDGLALIAAETQRR